MKETKILLVGTTEENQKVAFARYTPSRVEMIKSTFLPDKVSCSFCGAEVTLCKPTADAAQEQSKKIGVPITHACFDCYSDLAEQALDTLTKVEINPVGVGTEPIIIMVGVTSDVIEIARANITPEVFSVLISSMEETPRKCQECEEEVRVSKEMVAACEKQGGRVEVMCDDCAKLFKLSREIVYESNVDTNHYVGKSIKQVQRDIAERN